MPEFGKSSNHNSEQPPSRRLLPVGGIDHFGCVWWRPAAFRRCCFVNIMAAAVVDNQGEMDDPDI
jgi:hypothetical protein